MQFLFIVALRTYRVCHLLNISLSQNKSSIYFTVEEEFYLKAK